MAKGICGNLIPDTVVIIPKADYDEYQRLLNARDFICEDIAENRDITIPYLLKRLGGYKAMKLLEMEVQNAEDQTDWNEDNEL